MISATPYLETGRPPVDIGSRLELMTDNALLEQMEGAVSLCLHHPIPREIIDVVDDPYGCSYRYMTVFKDGELYRMYYGLPRQYLSDGEIVRDRERICYAESKNGIHWTRPSLGLFCYEGSRDNNIVWMENASDSLGVGGFSPFRDEHPECPEEHRYKAIAEAGVVGKKMFGCNGLLALSSPDGIHWSMLSAELVVKGGPGLGAFDSQNLAMWDGVRGEYRLYRREVFREPVRIFRDVLTATSRDFIHWNEPCRLSYPGAIPEQLYTNNVTPYYRAPHLFLGLPARYVQRGWGETISDLPERERRLEVIRMAGAEPTERAPTEAGGQRAGTALTDSIFMSSRDGISFHLWEEAFIRPGLRPRNNWFYGDNFVNWGIVPTPSGIEGAPDELSFYVSEASRISGQSKQCRRYTLRVDGFVSARASRRGGNVVTGPLRFSGGELVVNFSGSAAGSLRVELQTPRGFAYPGFSIEECIEMVGDDLERRVRWKGEPDLSALAGVPVKVCFRLMDADLYSFRFRPQSGYPSSIVEAGDRAPDGLSI